MDFTTINFMEYIPSYMYILVVALYVLGTILKVSSIPDKYIVYVLLIFGITIAVLLNIINSQYKTELEAVINGLLQGVICWGVATGTNQLYRQYNKEE